MTNSAKSFRAYLLFIEAWFFLAAARCLLLFFPFKTIVPILGAVNAQSAVSNTSDLDILALISLSIKRGCRYSPWRTKCFEQALAAKMMLKRRHVISTIFFGVYRNINDAKLNGHAWLESNGIIVTGGGDLEHFTVVGSFTG